MDQNDDRMETNDVSYDGYTVENLTTLLALAKLGIDKAEFQTNLRIDKPQFRNPEKLEEILKAELDKTIEENNKLLRLLGRKDPEDDDDDDTEGLPIGCMAESIVDLMEWNKSLQIDVNFYIQLKEGLERIKSGPSDNYEREFEKLEADLFPK